jgi:endo-1,4-beta-xylanase
MIPVTGLSAVASRAEGSMLAPIDRAQAGRRYFGAAVRFDQIADDAKLRETVLRDCSSITPEIHMKWDALRPEPDRWTTGPADDLVAFARQHGLKVRGHALLWEQSTPEWARTAVSSGDWGVVREHFQGVIDRFGEHVQEWDVVNEPIDANGRTDSLRETTFFRAYGPDYVARALTTAREFAPAAKLVINDYSFEYDNPVEDARRAGFLRLLRELRRANVPVDGVGLQAHLDLGKGPLRSEVLKPFLAAIADLGLEISVTELDVREHELGLPLAERDRRVADEVRRYLDIVMAQPAVTGVTTWGLSDSHSWLQPEGARGAKLNRGLPYDASLAPKPMREILRRQLDAA